MKLVGQVELNRRLNAIKDTKGLLKQVQLVMIREAKVLVPRKTGNLGRSIVPGQLTNTRATVEAKAGYAAFVEFGTKPHVIRPRKAKALAWASGSGRRLSGRPRKGAKLTFAKVVHHPGTKPHPFMLPAAQKAISQESMSEIVKKWNGAA